MSIAASQIFDFLGRQKTCTIERYEFSSAPFGILRRSLRRIVLKLRESDDQIALEISDRLRALLSEWLTVPIPFDGSMHSAIANVLGEAEAVQCRWGIDIRELYESALCSARELSSMENPVREQLQGVIQELLAREQIFKIYCHRRARVHFESVHILAANPLLLQNVFLHSVRDYRETQPFDILIKVGPLRARGWGSAPDALLTAPRFHTIIELVWSACGDDHDFGYDPVSPPVDENIAHVKSSSSSLKSGCGPIEWTKRVISCGEDPNADIGYSAAADDLLVFRTITQPRENRSAKLVLLNEEQGILYLPHSQVLSFNPDPAEMKPIGHRIPGETLGEGMFVITPLTGDVDLGGVHAEHGYYSKIWKTQLEKEWQADPYRLTQRLRKAGLNLVHLDAAIRNWCKPPSSVIHAPQLPRHFEILLRVLGVDGGDRDSQTQRPSPFWQHAWNEVRRSRGEAIHAGFQEQEIVDEHLIEILGTLLPQVREEASSNATFHLVIPDGKGIKGIFIFHRVFGIEEGFTVPVSELKYVRDLSVIDQWRD